MRVAVLVLVGLLLAVPASAVECSDLAMQENEPELVEGYVDELNGGCDADPSGGDSSFQQVDVRWFCGETGWFVRDGALVRDTDWLTVTLPSSGRLLIKGLADDATYVFVRAQDCDAPLVQESIELDDQVVRYMTVVGNPGEVIWVWVAPRAQDEPSAPESWEYWVIFDAVTPVEEPSWSSVKAMFD